MAQTDAGLAEPPLPTSNFKAMGSLRKWLNRHNGAEEPAEVPREYHQENDDGDDEPDNSGLIRRLSRRVVPELPRAQTFKRQQSERRNNLAPVEPTPAERRAVSVDRRGQLSRVTSQPQSDPRSSAPEFFSDDHADDEDAPEAAALAGETAWARDDQTLSRSGTHEVDFAGGEPHHPDALSSADAQSMTTSQYDDMIHDELESRWILNLSMHFRDKSKREKFFVTYRESQALWRRVTISLDYRSAPDNSLEKDLSHTRLQREKSAKIYEAIRDSLQDIQFYDTVTNLKLQTTEGRLHVHVVEDVNEIIQYPSVRQVQHLGCRLVRERDIGFDSHMSGFVYKVNVNGEVLIKKEIPGPDTIEEFLYEINALSRLGYSRSVIRFYGVVVDDDSDYVKGLLISYAEKGALIDVLFDGRQDGDAGIPWPDRERWARQIVEGLSDIHECGFVQGDFTLSNIVIDEHDDAKIIDINRRGCPVGWEPPEATPLIESNQRISMYIGVKSDLYQLGMVLWALATQEDEPEAQGRPLLLGPEVNVPDYYRQMVEICLSDEPRRRLHASLLLGMFPDSAGGAGNNYALYGPPSISVDDGYSLQEYFVDRYRPPNSAAPRIRTVDAAPDWPYANLAHASVDPSTGYSNPDPYYYTRGRSPPSPLPSHSGQWDPQGPSRNIAAWAARRDIAPSYSDVGADEIDRGNSATPTTNKESAAADAFGEQMGAVQLALAEATLSREHGTPRGSIALQESVAGLGNGPHPLREHPVSVAEHAGKVAGDGGSLQPVETGSLPITKDSEQCDNEPSISSATGNTAPEPQIVSIKEGEKLPKQGTYNVEEPATEFHGVITRDAENPNAGAPHETAAHETAAHEASAHDEAGATREDQPQSGSPAPPLSSSPRAELPELKGVGAAHEETDEQSMRARVSLDDDLETTCTPESTTEAQKRAS